MTKVAVIVSRHALDQLRRRDPEFAARSRNLATTIRYEVERALWQGRLAAHRPRWTRQRGGRIRRDSEERRSVRFATSDCDTCCYVLRRNRNEHGPNRSWVVVSVIVRHHNSQEAAA